ncbi:uncharacterized protein LOC129877355 [Solanum dulcamara]|uniref:uncharacterized protein LOC129877355 n=1 Tax=Solanum dulcamara TaxID=45834 RepID=UPI00248651BB|nr:uncharacterized protein LOC129877355 [Solanum dulcamara]XP_055808828.1 uncharacterized protein LOC129877355 [Solanum dulcamara]XP_055808829.1 uncharacterized protein LOC129877355 [Solanum dulcamara]
MAMPMVLSLSIHPSKPLQKPNSISAQPNSLSRRLVFLTGSTLFLSQSPVLIPISADAHTNSSTFLSGIVNTKSWFQFYGDGFSIRVPPEFQDLTEPEDYNAGLSLYGDKAKPKKFAARFASSDGSEVLSVIIRPSNQLKITFLEAKDITDLGSLKEASKIFVPAGSTLYSARSIKIKEDENFRTYYFYEFVRDEQHVALVAAVNSGKAFIAGATAPKSNWTDDGLKLRSAAVSITVL